MSFFLIIPALMIVGIYSLFEVFLYGLGITITLLVKHFMRLKSIRIKFDKLYLNVVTFSFIRVIFVLVVIGLFDFLDYYLFREKQGFWNDFYYQFSQVPIIFLMIMIGLIVDLTLLFLSLFLLKNNMDKKLNYFIRAIAIFSSLVIGTASVMLAYIVTVWAS